MPINNTDLRAESNANGSTTTFAIPGTFFDDSEVTVTVFDTATNTATAAVKGVDYSISKTPVANNNGYTGNIVWIGTPPPTGKKVIRQIVPSFLQDILYPENGDFPSTAHNEGLDRAARRAQYVNMLLTRCVHMPLDKPGSFDFSLPYPLTPDALLAVNSTGSGLKQSSVSLATLLDATATVSANIDAVETVAGVATQVSTVAGISTQVSTVADNTTNVNTNAANIASINTNATNITAIQNASANATTATTKAAEAAASATAAAGSASAAAATVTGFSAGAIVGFDTKANMDANLAYAAGTVAWVLSDSTLTNNIMYRKVGASGSGSWAASTDRISLVDNRLQIVESEVQVGLNDAYALAVVDQNNKIALVVDAAGKLIPNAMTIPASATISDDSATAITSRIPPTGVTQGLEVETTYQYAFCVLDSNNKIKFAVPLDGVLKGKIEAAVAADTIADGGVSYNSLSASLKSTLASNRYVTQTVGSNLYVEDRTTGTRKLISTASPTSPNIIDNAYVTYIESGTWKYQPVASGTANLVLPTSRLTLWGDSLTAASAGVSAVGSVLGITTLNKGQSGYGVTDIAIRQGGVQPLITVTSNQIPASGAVSVTAISPTTGYRTGVSISFTGSLAGIAGTLAKDASEVWTFTRTASGSITSCPAGTPFICDVNVGTENDVQSIWMGRNNVGSATFQADTLTNVAACVAYMKPLYKRYCVISVTNSTSEVSGTSGYNSIIAVNNALKAVYGDRFYDLRTDFIQNGLATAGVTPSASDLTAVAADSPPPSLMSDSVHPNSTGYAAQKVLFANWLTSKGYFA